MELWMAQKRASRLRTSVLRPRHLAAEPVAATEFVEQQLCNARKQCTGFCAPKGWATWRRQYSCVSPTVPHSNACTHYRNAPCKVLQGSSLVTMMTTTINEAIPQLIFLALYFSSLLYCCHLQPVDMTPSRYANLPFPTCRPPPSAHPNSLCGPRLLLTK